MQNWLWVCCLALTLAAPAPAQEEDWRWSGVERVVDDTIRARDGEIGHLSIGYTDFAISGVLPVIMQEFRQAHPDITVDLAHMVTLIVNDRRYRFVPKSNKRKAVLLPHNAIWIAFWNLPAMTRN